MKIAFVGKGGSGKSTVATLFAKYLAAQKKQVLAIDADINQHFGTLLGFSLDEIKALPSLGHEIAKVRMYVQGDNKRIMSPSHLRMTTPPANGSRVIHPNAQDPFLSRYITNKDGVHFATTGEFEASDVGMICYHGKTMSTEIVFNHLADANDEYVLVDMTAGADTFSTGIFLKFDMLALVVEPTAQSLSVFTQFKEYTKEYTINVKVVGNKIEDAVDEDFIKNYVGDAYLGCLPYSKEIRNLEKNKLLAENFITDITPVMETIKINLDNASKNWNKFYDDLVTLHKKHAESWLNNAFQTNFEDQIDPTFNPEKFYQR